MAVSLSMGVSLSFPTTCESFNHEIRLSAIRESFHPQKIPAIRYTSLAFDVPPYPCLPRVPFNAQVGELGSNGIKIAKCLCNTLNHETVKIFNHEDFPSCYSSFYCRNMSHHHPGQVSKGNYIERERKHNIHTSYFHMITYIPHGRNLSQG